MIVVFDTNVLIAAIITEGICSKLLRRARAGKLTYCMPFYYERTDAPSEEISPFT